MKKTTYHDLIFKISYSSDCIPQFETQEDQDKFFRALGRMVFYAMLGPDQDKDTVKIVNASLGKDPLEILGVYFAPLPSAEMGEDGYPVYYRGPAAEIDNTLLGIIDKSREVHRPFTMAAIKHRNGEFGFHS